MKKRLFYLFIAYIIISYSCSNWINESLCGYEIFQTISAPDKKHKIIVFERNCGATTSFSTQISLLKMSESLENEKGNLFIIEGHPDNTEIEVHWDTNQSVHVAYSKNRHYEQDPSKMKSLLRSGFKFITIEYTEKRPSSD